MKSASVYPWLNAELLQGRPSVGALMGLCEENYATLRRLIPSLPDWHGAYRASRPGDLDLYLAILDQAPYTTTLRLTYCFPAREAGAAAQLEPDALLRVYHDARQVEILRLSPKALPPLRHPDEPLLLDKWRLNRFLGKWLDYCVRQGYAFRPAVPYGHPADSANLPLSTALAVCL